MSAFLSRFKAKDLPFLHGSNLAQKPLYMYLVGTIPSKKLVSFKTMLSTAYFANCKLAADINKLLLNTVGPPAMSSLGSGLWEVVT